MPCIAASRSQGVRPGPGIASSTGSRSFTWNSGTIRRPRGNHSDDSGPGPGPGSGRTGRAAAHSLFWDEAAARAELERQVASGCLAAVDAGYTLREFDCGRLNMTGNRGERRRGPAGHRSRQPADRIVIPDAHAPAAAGAYVSPGFPRRRLAAPGPGRLWFPSASLRPANGDR